MEETTIRECTTIEEFDGCLSLQREAFGLPDLELSPRRHLIVSRQAGGWTLGAFAADRMVGFVHTMAAVRANEFFGYSHMMAVAKDYRLGATVDTYAGNFYGIDYSADASITDRIGLPSDRLFATWHLDSQKVRELANGTAVQFEGKQAGSVSIPSQWNALVKSDPKRALEEQTRVRGEFQNAFARGLICAGFERGEEESRYLLFEIS
jgi:predicted GNAT superfamily acetyltransferase